MSCISCGTPSCGSLRCVEEKESDESEGTQSDVLLFYFFLLILGGYACWQLFQKDFGKGSLSSWIPNWISNGIPNLPGLSTFVGCFLPNYQTSLLESERDFQLYNLALTKFEQRLSSYYPLGDKESFRISHGKDYSAFFRRMGQAKCILVFGGNSIVATCFVVCRRVPFPCWYIADLKVDRRYRNLGLVAFLYHKYHKYFTQNQVTSGFGVSMSGGSSSSKVKRIAESLGCETTRLSIYLLDHVTTTRLCEKKILAFKELISMENKKDLILKSTNRPLPLLHAVPIFEEVHPRRGPILLPSGYSYMFCCPESSSLFLRFQKVALLPFASALIYSRGMKATDFAFLNTSEI